MFALNGHCVKLTWCTKPELGVTDYPVHPHFRNWGSDSQRRKMLVAEYSISLQCGIDCNVQKGDHLFP